MAIPRAVAALLLCAVGGNAHGYMTQPPTRQNGTLAQGGGCVWPGVELFPWPARQPDAQKPVFNHTHALPTYVGAGKDYGSCLWFQQGCTIGCSTCGGTYGNATCAEQGVATLPRYARTYDLDRAECGVNPWCAPGTAPVLDPCGLSGGEGRYDKFPDGHYGPNGLVPAYGALMGDKGTDLPAGPVTSWKAGSTQEVAWAITANHGGGYQYRLCAKSEAQTEACFRKTPLRFVGESHEIVYGDVSRQRQSIPATYVTEGVVPQGSTWARNPIPGCSCIYSPCDGQAGGNDSPLGCTHGFQFPPSAGSDLGRPGYPLGGYGQGTCNAELPARNCTEAQYEAHLFQWSVADKVAVPKDLPLGEYTLSFRWDSEETPQIWSSCSDIRIH